MGVMRAKTETKGMVIFMRDGFIKVAAGTPRIRVADCRYNAEQIFTLCARRTRRACACWSAGAVSDGYTCNDLFCQPTLLDGALEGAFDRTGGHAPPLPSAVAGMPFRHGNGTYNCAVVIQRGEVLGVVPKTNLPNYRSSGASLFYPRRF
jgi:NAD+ synthase (glutamine-hydrolysing)